ncbi:hypothetical protein ACOSQ2_011293 [Xanthoceras sorbifolium]|uniref:Homeobox domain-containing protein n=1 Tax=Xanthoceras sorbifolium TaxID=99658 RepID=A0ABQ8HSF9_9ROSI|nr:hypothetical protein JRO89_XS07G0033800 [Xanthoceras sorbifolium]
MASYNPGLSYQREGFSTPFPGDQKFVTCVDPPSHPGHMTMYANQTSSAGPYSEILSGSSFPPNSCVDISSTGGRNEMVFIPPTSDAVSLPSIDGQSNTGTGNSVTGDTQVIPTQPSILDGEHNFSCQGLSLSLGTQMTSPVSMPSLQYQYQYQYQNLGFSSCLSTHLPVSGKETVPCEGDESDKLKGLRNSDCLQSGSETEALCNPQCSVSYKEMHPNMYQYEQIGFANTILKSKYLRAAQRLLDEVLNVRKALKQTNSNKDQSLQGTGVDDSKTTESMTNSSSELSPTERQDLRNKKTKLLSMLDEIDRRYKQYYYQMQTIVTSFDMVAGHGAAKMYTALALQTISRHFRSLRDAISGQIQVTQRSLGEQETSANGHGGSIPRLRFVDHQLRQQRALQQLGVMRHAWRPQRGLPESSVSVLRAWLFEHFLHPYPNDSEKMMLAKQTGLSRNQVANWFINARVRLWKPMVEEMYKEEFGDPEVNFKSSPENAAKACNENSSAPEDRGEELKGSQEPAAGDTVHLRQVHGLKSDHTLDVEKNRPITRSEFQNGADGDFFLNYGMMKLQDDQRENTGAHNLYSDEIIPHNQNGNDPLMGATATYGISELSGFAIGNQVSLALGLQHRESDAFSVSAGTHNGGNNAVGSVGHDTVDYHCMDPGNQQDRFGNPHLLHDFVV